MTTQTKTNTRLAKYTIGKKKAAINELMGSNLTRKHVLEVAHKHGLTYHQLEVALTNFLNYGYIDGRMKTPWAAKASHTTTLKMSKKAKTKYKQLRTRIGSYKFQPLDSKHAGNLIHEFIFSSTDRAMRFLDKKQINVDQWYQWLRELSTEGTLLGRKIFDYKAQRKIRMTTVVKVIRDKKKG